MTHVIFLVMGLAVALCMTFSAQAGEQQARHFEKEVVRKLKLDYLLALPAEYEKDSQKQWPLVLFLHGAGERGSDLDHLKRHGPPRMIEQGEQIPAIVVSPQCPAQSWWPQHAETLSLLLDEIEADYRVDASRIYLTGLSMGGYGSWALAAAEPERFAAVVQICGGGDPEVASRLVDVPIWAFHGDADGVVAVQESQQMVEAIKRAGGEKIRLTIYPGVGHDSWTKTYKDPQMWSWLFEQQREEK